VAAFSAAGLLQIPLVGNSAYLPLANMPGANVTWMNAMSPIGSDAYQFTYLCNVNLYERCIVKKTTLEWQFNPSDTSANDGIIVTVTPSNTAAGADPANTQTAMKQPYTKYKEIRALGSTSPKFSITIDWAKFLGLTDHDFENDPSNSWSHVYNGLPGGLLYLVTCINTLDCVQPTATIPFTVNMIHHVKFFEFDAAQDS
jgi:hypothetical protein